MTQPQDSEPDARAALEHYGSALRHFFQRRIGDRRAEVDDLVQEVFVRLFNRRGREPIDNLTGYVFQIAANLLRERSSSPHATQRRCRPVSQPWFAGRRRGLFRRAHPRCARRLGTD